MPPQPTTIYLFNARHNIRDRQTILDLSNYIRKNQWNALDLTAEQVSILEAELRDGTLGPSFTLSDTVYRVKSMHSRSPTSKRRQPRIVARLRCPCCFERLEIHDGGAAGPVQNEPNADGGTTAAT